jgi:hypothetical protein
LYRAERTYSTAKNPAKEYRQNQRGYEKGDDTVGNGKVGIDERHCDILNGPDWADTAFSVEPEIGQAPNRKIDEPAAISLFNDYPST